MNVSKQSWHYRFINNFSNYPPPGNLCPYMRKLMLFILMFPAGALGAIFFISLATAPLWFSFLESDTSLAFAVMGGAIDIIILFFIWSEYRAELTHPDNALHDELLPGLEIQPPAFFALIAAWFRAKHDQVCPEIDFLTEE